MNSSKERLKQFKNSLDFLDDSADMSDYHRLIDTLENLYKDGELDWIHRFASKQSGRVQELESINKQNESVVYRLVGEEEMWQQGTYKTEMQKLEEQNKRYRMLLKEVNSVILETINSLNKGEKVNGLGFMYNSINQQLEIFEALEGDPHESS